MSLLFLYEYTLILKQRVPSFQNGLVFACMVWIGLVEFKSVISYRGLFVYVRCAFTYCAGQSYIILSKLQQSHNSL